MESDKLSIPLNGLTSGRTCFRWNVGKEFFEEFGNSDISDATLTVDCDVERSGRKINVDCRMDGTLTVACDRCLSPVEMKISPFVRLRVRYGAESGEGDAPVEEDGREMVYVGDGETELDMRQTVYDYACLSLPMQCRHPEGECDRSVTERLSPSADRADGSPADESADNPFAALKGLFEC